MVVLKDDHELPTVFDVTVLVSFSEVCFELKMRYLKHSIEVKALKICPITKITGSELVTIIVRAGDVEVPTHGRC